MPPSRATPARCGRRCGRRGRMEAMNYVRRALGLTLHGQARSTCCARCFARGMHAVGPSCCSVLSRPRAAPRAAQVVLLTGAGGGLGGELACALAAEGCHLCLSDTNEQALQRAQARAVQQGGGAARVIAVPADLRARGDVERLARECEAAFGRIDILVNNGTPRTRATLHIAPPLPQQAG
jgi:hypothetical protein